MKDKGITLIALVVTIIVLLILAGVSIATLTGENGIFKRAQEAKARTEEAEKDENAKLQELDDLINEIDTVILKKGEKAKKTQKNNYIDTYGNKATIPEGFKVSVNSTEDDINEGLVVKDDEENEFVWVPVGKIKVSNDETKTIELKRYEFNVDTGDIDEEKTKVNPSDKYGTYESKYFIEGKKSESTLNGHAKDIEKFISSVKRYGGYYIGRYEARKATDGKLTEIKTDPVYNNIVQNESSQKAKEMYINRNDLESDLVNWYAWSTTIVFIQNLDGVVGDEQPYSIQKPKYTRPMEFGTCSGEMSDDMCDCKYNIYDMAGNAREFLTTSFSDTSSPCVLAGGSWFKHWKGPQGRDWVSLDYTDSDCSFRPILYLN